MTNFFHNILSVIGTSIISIGLLFTGGNSAVKVIVPIISSSTLPIQISTSTPAVIKNEKIVNPVQFSSSTINKSQPKEILTKTVLPLSVSCIASQSPVNINQGVEWTAEVSGGTGVYSYLWSGNDNLKGTTKSIVWNYDTVGIMSANLSITSGEQSVNVACTNSVQVTQIEAQPTQSPTVQNNNLNTAQIQINALQQQILNAKQDYYNKILSVQQSGESVSFGNAAALNFTNQTNSKINQLVSQVLQLESQNNLPFSQTYNQIANPTPASSPSNCNLQMYSDTQGQLYCY